MAFLYRQDRIRSAGALGGHEAKPALWVEMKLHLIAVVPGSGATKGGRDARFGDLPYSCQLIPQDVSLGAQLSLIREVLVVTPPADAEMPTARIYTLRRWLQHLHQLAAGIV